MKRVNCIILALGIFMLLFLNAGAQMFWNQACSFAGSNSSYIAVRPSSSLNITGSFTMEAWVNPANSLSPSSQMIMQKRLNAGLDGYTLYLNNGRVAIRTNATTRLIGNEIIPSNKWTHIAGTYYAPGSLFKIFVNGVIDTTVTIAGASPVANTDSLWIGKGSSSPFAGMMDEIRVWKFARTDLSDYIHTTLSSNHSELVLSLTFQDNESLGNLFSLTDWSENTNISYNRGVTIADLSNRPSSTVQMNDCARFITSNDYLAGPDDPAVSPTQQITLSAWIYSWSDNGMIIHKGTPSSPGVYNYSLELAQGYPIASINSNFGFISYKKIPLNRWTHLCFTYHGPTQAYQIFINGVLAAGGILNAGSSIGNGVDSIYIGGGIPSRSFNGFIDEVRILPVALNAETINQYMFQSIDEGNYGIGEYAIYNLDGYTESNNSMGPKLYFREYSDFGHTGGFGGQPQSPMCRADNLNFEDGYYLKTSDRRIPASGNSGNMITDTLRILHNEIINDINVFIGLNHNEIIDIEVFLIAPNGNPVQLFNNHSLIGNGSHLTTIFDDQADSSLVNDRYISFSPRIKPYQNLNSVAGGQSSAGLWKLMITDNVNNSSRDTGRLYGWGIQINNEPIKSHQLDVTSLVQGFYNNVSNSMIPDTMKYYLRSFQIPFSMFDSSKVKVNSNGLSSVFFTNALAGQSYYIQLKHRNSIETWGSIPFKYDALTLQSEYDFTNASNNAFGNNMIQVDTSPVKFAIYSGDPNQDGTVDVNDLVLVYNDGLNFVSGYVPSDINGDDFTDVSDLVITYNNSINFVSKITP